MEPMDATTQDEQPVDKQAALEAADPADAPDVAEDLARTLQDDLDRVAGSETEA